jgi:hypothetical protein
MGLKRLEKNCVRRSQNFVFAEIACSVGQNTGMMAASGLSKEARVAASHTCGLGRCDCDASFDPQRILQILVAAEIDVTQCSPPELQAERRKA